MQRASLIENNPLYLCGCLQFIKCFHRHYLFFHLIMFLILGNLLVQTYLHDFRYWVKCLRGGGEKSCENWSFSHGQVLSILERQHPYDWLIFLIPSGCFVISFRLTFKKRKKKLENIFSIFYLAGFPDISSIFYLLASEVKVGHWVVDFFNHFFFLIYTYLPFEKFIYPSLKIHPKTNKHTPAWKYIK